MFRIEERGSSVRAEVIGGVTTFVSMAYIIVVNPAILAFAGIPPRPSTVATIVVAAFGTLLMALYANRPIAVAPYMGENAFIAFGLAAFGITWQQRLGAVFVSGIIFIVITLLGIRKWLASAVSPSMKHSFAAGIYYEKRLSLTQRRFLKAVETLAKVKKLLSEADYRDQQAKHKRGQATLTSQQLLRNLTHQH